MELFLAYWNPHWQSCIWFRNLLIWEGEITRISTPLSFSLFWFNYTQYDQYRMFNTGRFWGLVQICWKIPDNSPFSWKNTGQNSPKRTKKYRKTSPKKDQKYRTTEKELTIVHGMSRSPRTRLRSDMNEDTVTVRPNHNHWVTRFYGTLRFKSRQSSR